MTRTQIGILWGTGLLVVLALLVLGQVLGRSSPSSMALEPASMPAPAYRLPDISESARGLYPVADQAARSWQPDAQLTSALANWPFVQVDDLSEPTAWTFHFYSPATRQVYVASVDGAQVTVLRTSLSPYALPTIPPEAWPVDSPQALSAWLTHGGGELLDQHSIVDVSARLRVSQSGRPQWVVVGLVRDTETMQLVRVDALNGEVLE